MVTPPPGCCDLIHAVCPGSFCNLLQVFVFIDHFIRLVQGLTRYIAQAAKIKNNKLCTVERPASLTVGGA
jgi:hypothetical protein